MPATWVLLGDDDERERFATLALTLALPATPAGPPNRLRQVARLEAGGRTWFLKTFRATQRKNRWKFRCTAPRAQSDAERELRVTEALRTAGVATPRPVAWGTDGPASYYLCAELPGRPLAECWAATGAPGLLPAAAAFCGALLARGFWLPDLSPDHVFVENATGLATFAVLDLHNGRRGRAGPPPFRLLRRVLRRFAKAARQAPVTQLTALRFAGRLLHAAGRSGQLRAVLAPLPPMRTAARYEAGGKSQAYADRNPGRAARERALLRAVWPGHHGETVLDLPCGAGRLLPLLRDELGHRVQQGDGARQMLLRAREAGHGAPLQVQADALELPFADGAVDGVVAFRFLHHLPSAPSDRAIAEACRVARRFVVVSFFHPCSVHHLQRRLGQVLARRAATRFARTLGDVRRAFARHGFRLARRAAELPFARDLWVASFVRT